MRVSCDLLCESSSSEERSHGAPNTGPEVTQQLGCQACSSYTGHLTALCWWASRTTHQSKQRAVYSVPSVNSRPVNRSRKDFLKINIFPLRGAWPLLLIAYHKSWFLLKWSFLCFLVSLLESFITICMLKCLPACMLLHPMCLVPTEARRRHLMPYNWGYRWLWASTWVLRMEPGSSARAASAFDLWAIFPALL